MNEPLTQSNRAVPIVAAITAGASAVAMAKGYIVANNGFGSGDIPAMVTWSVPLALLVYLCFRPITRRISSSSGVWAYLLMAPVGAVVGLIWTIMASLVLGGYMAAFSFPIVLCWVGGGILAGLVAALMTAPKWWPMAIAVSLLTVFVFARATSYAQSSPSHAIRVVLAPGLSNSDVDRFWREVIGGANPKASGHVLADGIAGAGVADYQDGSPVIMVDLRSRISDERRDSILAMIRRSPLVRSASLTPTSDQQR